MVEEVFTFKSSPSEAGVEFDADVDVDVGAGAGGVVLDVFVSSADVSVAAVAVVVVCGACVAVLGDEVEEEVSRLSFLGDSSFFFSSFFSLSLSLSFLSLELRKRPKNVEESRFSFFSFFGVFSSFATSEAVDPGFSILN